LVNADILDGTVGIAVVSGNAPTSLAVYVGLLAYLAQSAISLVYK